ncbi:MAG: HSP90 family protein [Microbacteriaceae bacterium]
MNEPEAGSEAVAQPFQVDLRGVIDLLSRHIYSSPQVFLRELLQNGRDAIAARTEVDGVASAGGIRIIPVSDNNDTFTFIDDGIGLTVDEVGELLATVGRSSKRDILDLPRSDYLGQFGIGLLSCFMVADSIVIRSRSAKGGPGVEWVGSADGTFTTRELNAEDTAARPIGTEVLLQPRADEVELLGTPSIIALATRFGEFLRTPIRVDLPTGGTETINREAHFAQPFERASDDLLDYGRSILGAAPFEAIPLSVPGTGTRGTAFVLPFAPPPGARQASRVYLGSMLLSERVDDLLPDWAFFVRSVVDTTALHPTASREQLVADEALEFTRDELGAALRRWIVQLATTRPHRLAEFVAIHHVALRSLVASGDDIAPALVRWLTIETSIGTQTIGDLVRRTPHVRFAETVDEFQQIAGIASPSSPIVNGGYVYDTNILRRLPEYFPGVTVEQVTVMGELDSLDSPPLADRAAALALEQRATAALSADDCEVEVRSFSPADLPGLYVADPDVLRSIERGKTRDVASGLWGSVVGRVDDFYAGERAASGASPATARLCLNWSNPLVRTLATLDDDAVLSRSVQLVYVQSLLAGHRPLRASDRVLLSSALTDLVHLTVGLPDLP